MSDLVAVVIVVLAASRLNIALYSFHHMCLISLLCWFNEYLVLLVASPNSCKNDLPTLPHLAPREKLVGWPMGRWSSDCTRLHRMQRLQGQSEAVPGCSQREEEDHAWFRWTPAKGAQLYLVGAPDLEMEAWAFCWLQEGSQPLWSSSLLRWDALPAGWKVPRFG